MKLLLYRQLLKSARAFEQLSRKASGAARQLLPPAKVSIAQCEAIKWQNVRPCFVLSTGRSGTLLLTKLLELSPHIAVVHQPKPELVRASKLAYEQIKNSPDIFRETFKSAREEYVLEALMFNQVFVETNNRITFFAPIIRDVFPNAAYIHLVRHPGDFVRSGIRRHWYSDQHEHDIGRIVPYSGDIKSRWPSLTAIEKIGWLWHETNQFIEDAKENLPEQDVLFVQAEQLFADVRVTQAIFSFLQQECPPLSLIKKNLTPTNVQKKGDFPPYSAWPESDRQLLQNIAPLMKKYNYR
ncbi:hypothetical protein EH223_04910 [candidate division KSB1 bacterium]|nr:sulfotransferase [candidate division KSB1 bacterium]RQW05377.1 MAG: hypothetical protein EH223_04910 [candidate division KSB1 bacterium]